MLFDIRFYQATATVIPTLLIAATLSSRYVESTHAKDSPSSKSVILTLLFTAAIVGEAASLYSIASGDLTPSLFIAVAICILIELLLLGVLTMLPLLSEMKLAPRLYVLIFLLGASFYAVVLFLRLLKLIPLH